MHVLDADQVARLLPSATAVAALNRYFTTPHAIEAPQRTQLPFADGVLLTMPATGSLTSRRAAADPAGTPDRTVGGVKVVTVRAANAEIGAPTVQAVYLLFGGPTLAPLAVIDGPALTNIRTAAVSALAAKYLARTDATRLVLFGAGAQARAHLTALTAVRPIEEVVVISRTESRAAELVTIAREAGLSARLGEPGDISTADIVCCCTTSAEPLFDGALLRPGAHVIAVGAYRPDLRELDEATMRRGPVVVEDRAAAGAEAGELTQPAAAGRPVPIAADLAEMCSGAAIRTSAADITVFKSVGIAAEDLVLADAIYRAAAANDGA